jgi:type II secretory pathway pseudopilin PulG
MVETIVGLALLTIAISLGMNYISVQQNARAVRKFQSTVRFLAIQATQEATLNYKFYPPILPPNPTDQPLYVACFKDDGNKVPNIKTTSRDFQFAVIPNYKQDVASGMCDPLTSKFEVRFYWITPIQSDININIFNLRYTPRDSYRLLFKNFKVFAK